MKSHNGFEQAYNAQISVKTQSMLITGNYVTDSSNDKQELSANVEQAKSAAFTPNEVLSDCGYFSQEQVELIEKSGDVTVFCAVKRETHGCRIEDLKGSKEQKILREDATIKQKMQHRLESAAGKALYRLRKQTVEPVFGIIKQAMGFRQFLTRGITNVSNEFNLICVSYNLKRLFTLNELSKTMQTT